MTSLFSNADLASLAFFVLAWLLYHFAVESEFFGKKSLNSLMHQFRNAWMANMLEREERIVDTQIMSSLQNGTAFFASTSLFAIGGSLALLRATDDVLKVFSDLPLGLDTSRGLWELKVSGIVIIFVYAFFKFAWAYRLFNYGAILIGATGVVKGKVSADIIDVRGEIHQEVQGRLNSLSLVELFGRDSAMQQPLHCIEQAALKLLRDAK